jgi:hypothetical protein
MKNIFFAIVGLVNVTAAEHASACSQPLPIIRQQMALQHVVESDAYSDALKEVTQNDPWVSVESITFAGGVVYTFSNGCVATFNERYAPPSHIGMCPRFIDVESTVECN